MWPFRKKTIPAQCVCHILDPRNDAPVTQLREIGNGRGQVPREMYERFNDDGNMFLVFMASEGKPGEMDGWFVPKEQALEFADTFFDKNNELSHLMRLAATPADQPARDRAIDDFMKAWIFYNEKLTFKPTVSLAEFIRGFSIPMRARWENVYPTLRPWGDWLFWSVIEDAISREGRIQPNAVKAAVADASRVAP
jgi:hypothetical protein